MIPATTVFAPQGGLVEEREFQTGRVRVAMLCIHSSPLGDLGTEDTGGMSVYVRELSRALGQSGHRVDVYTCAGDPADDHQTDLSGNARVIHLDIGQGRTVKKGDLFKYLPDVFTSLRAYLTDNRLHYDLIHSHYWLSGSVGLMARECCRLPHVMSFHTIGMAKRVSCAQEREPTPRLATERDLARASDRIIASSERDKELLERYYKVSGEKIAVVPCGVDLARFRPTGQESARRQLGLKNAGSVVLYVGRFAPVKGIERLVAAVSHLRDHRGLRLEVVGGDGPGTPETTRLRRFIAAAGLGDIVTLCGRVDHSLLPTYYNAADVLVVPSYYESFGLVALESLACGTPVVATQVGAMNSLIRDGYSGEVVDRPTPRALACAIEKLIDGRVSTASRGEIRASISGYAWSHIAGAVRAEYEVAMGIFASRHRIDRGRESADD
ncbi:MAG: glycosyltransferase [Chloroflexota bacterium]